MTACARDCTTRCRCDECLASDTPSHGRQAVQAIDGAVLCQRCADKLLGHLTGIPEAIGRLDTSLAARSDNDGIKHGKATGSPALLRLDVLALKDPNTRWDGSRGELRYATGELIGWTQRLSHELGFNADPITWFQQLITYQWSARMLDELNDLAGVLARANGETRRAVGHCIAVIEHDGLYANCGTAMYAKPGSDVVQCRSCGRRYVGGDLLRVKLTEEATA